MKKITIILFSVLTVNAWAQKETVIILTSASCFEGVCCKERIEEEMQFTRGVTAVDLDIESQVLTATFKTNKTDADKLRKAISLIGYNADDVKANKKAHDNLPSCCQHLEFKEE
jgi:copper chaperone CopZ